MKHRIDRRRRRPEEILSHEDVLYRRESSRRVSLHPRPAPPPLRLSLLDIYAAAGPDRMMTTAIARDNGSAL